MSLPLAAMALAAILSAACLVLLCRLRAHLPAAHPNERTLHRGAIPRVGGLALWAGFLPVALGVGGALPGGYAAWLPPFAALVLVSLADDARGAHVALRLIVHAVAALWAAVMLWRLPGGGFPGVVAGAPYVLDIAGTALVLAWGANLYNFMDGNDGLAGATALIGFAALGLGAAQDPALRVAALALAAASVPFLAVNRPPARLFLGDVGAVPLGFLAGVFGVGGAVRGDWPLWFPLLVFLPFVADATVTLLRRLVQGERVWQAHRSHYYQRLHRLGAGHAGTLATYAALTVGCAVTALACLVRAPAAGMLALGAWALGLSVLFAGIDYHWRRKPATR
jgi:UDP-N-acetylmuramyl pentapeptide phosphotransferase/UDP-N-acetylglucosamine-1-phosphate transferase